MKAKAPASPKDQVHICGFFFFYSEDDKPEIAKYWARHWGKSFFDSAKDDMKVNDEVKAALPGIIGDATTPEEKLQRIYDFCRIKIKNLDDDASGMSEDEKKKIKENKSPSDTLKKGMGTGSNINYLFGALAKAAGFDARLAVSGNRENQAFERGSLANVSFLTLSFIAVKIGDEWQSTSVLLIRTRRSECWIGWTTVRTR